MSEAKFATWTVPQSPVDIEYSLLVLDEIRQVVAEGFQRLSRGGIEVGGVLYGTLVGRKLRIMAMREIACEHARGPTFILSENDRALLAGQLEREREDPRLSGLRTVGWFLSHTRSEITLQQGDLETYNTFFPERWQVTMVIRPGRAGVMRAGFFVREADGSVKTDQSYHDFQFPDRIAGMPERPRERPAPETLAAPPPAPRYERRAPRYEPPAEAAEAVAPPSSTLQAEPAEPEEQEDELAAPYPPPQRKLPWGVILVVAIALIAAVLGMRFFGPRLNPETFSLSLSERDGELQVHWNPRSQSIANAARGSLDLIEGPKPSDRQTAILGPRELASGSFTYARKTGDVQVKMVVTGPGGSIEEGSRYLGPPPPVDANEADLNQVQRDALQDEVTRLRQQNGQQAERIQQLERTLTVLRTRLGIAQDAK